MDYDVQRCTRVCTATGRELAEGEVFYSALVAKGAEVERHDYSAEAWQGPPDDALGWWRAQVPTRAARRARLAPNDVLLEFFHELEDQPDKQDLLYVLTLFLVRRRVFRLEDDHPQAAAADRQLVVSCPREDATYTVSIATPSQQRIEEIQDQLAQLLFADAA
mgnify:CR=1 FL=1